MLNNRVSPELIAREQNLDPQVYCGPMVALLSDSNAPSIKGLGGHVLEGWRGESTADSPVFGPTDLRRLELELKPHHSQPPGWEGKYSVRPGDVLVNKVWPVRAAWITEAMFRHRFESSCYAIRGLRPADGFWLALCLNQLNLAYCLLRKSGAGVLPRIRMSALQTFRFPRTPMEATFLSQQFADCLNDRVASTLELFRLREDVNLAVETQLPEELPDDAMDSNTADDGPLAWNRFFEAVDVGDSLVPRHVAVNARQSLLRRNSAWLPLPRVVDSFAKSQERLGRPDSSFYLLRLSDVRDDLRLPLSVPCAEEGNRRISAQPLRENEVLLSLLVSNPRAVFVGHLPAIPIHPADHWQRLRFRDTQGAWALILQSPPVVAQLRRLATGSVQQFASPATLSQLVVPDFPLDIRQKWDQRLRRWQLQRDELEERWVDLHRHAYELLKRTEREYGRWVTPLISEVAHDA